MLHQRGLSLTELLVTLAVLAILVGVVFPGFEGIMRSNNLTTSANSFVLAVQYARSEAARRGRSVAVCPVDDSAGGNEWGPGWQVVLRDTGESCDDAIAAADVLRTFGAIEDPLTFDSPTDVTEYRFTSQGRLVGGNPQNVDMCIPGQRGVRVGIAATGRPSTSDLDAAACP